MSTFAEQHTHIHVQLHLHNMSLHLHTWKYVHVCIYIYIHRHVVHTLLQNISWSPLLPTQSHCGRPSEPSQAAGGKWPVYLVFRSLGRIAFAMPSAQHNPMSEDVGWFRPNDNIPGDPSSRKDFVELLRRFCLSPSVIKRDAEGIHGTAP